MIKLLNDTFLSGINASETVHVVGSCLFVPNVLYINRGETSQVVDCYKQTKMTKTGRAPDD